MGQFESGKEGSKMSRKKERPAWVERAVHNDDLEALRFAAKKSHEVQVKKRSDTAEAAAYYREQEIAREDAEATRLAEVEREHIVPLESEQEEA